MEPPGTVFIVDDDPAVCRALVRLMEEVSLTARAYGGATEFLKEYDPSTPGCLVLDVRMAGMSGTALHEKLLARGVEIPIIFITGHGDIEMAVSAMRRGAVDFIEKPFNPQYLLNRIQQALADDAKNRRARRVREEVARRFELLTARERDVVELVVAGLSNKQIAAKLEVRPQTIDACRANAMKKLLVDSVAELTQLVVKQGIV